MKARQLRYLLITGLFLILSHYTVKGQNKANDIVGEWITNTKGGHVLIYEREGKYYGKLKLSADENAVDNKNTDPKLRTRKIMGMIMLNAFVFDGENTWKNGTIYDPSQGKTYSCKLSLNSTNELKVRGYIGLSLFGRTDLWTRMNKK